MCLSYSLDGGMTVKRWYPGQPLPTDLFEAIARGEPVFAHNATFEINIWRNVMVAKHGWPPVADNQWRCTQSEALAVGLPAGLEKIAEGMELPVKKDMAGRRLMLRMSKPRKPTKKDPSLWHEKPEDKERLLAYCDQDVLSEIAVHNVVPRLNNRELQVYHYDQKVNRRGIPFDRELAEAALWVWDEHTKELTAELIRITDGQVRSSREVAKMLTFLAGLSIYPPDLKKLSVEEALRGDLPPVARRVLEIRQELALSSVSKYVAVIRSIEDDGRVRGCVQYHAAQTGRWGGRLIQVQNFPRGVLDKSELERIVSLVKRRNLGAIKLLMPIGDLLSSLLRSVILAPPGKKLIVSDFASVEARGLAWMAGEDWLLNAFRNKEDAYKVMASEIYSVPVEKVDKAQRFMGKTAVLGCGYQMGGTKFQASLANQGVSVTIAACEQIVKAYRKKNPNISSHWYATEKAAVNAVRTGTRHEIGPFTYHIKGDWLLCRLPAGRDIAYYKPRLVPGKYGPQISYLGVDKTGKLVKTSTYGGKLVENNCISEGTPVLTRRGWVAIERVLKSDEVHDGVDFVNHSGVVSSGLCRVGNLFGIDMTGDHRVLTERGWISASQCEGFTWQKVRGVSCDKAPRVRRKKEHLARGVRLRESRPVQFKRPVAEKEYGYPIVRLYGEESRKRKEEDTRNEQAPLLRSMAIDDGSMQITDPPSVCELRRPRHPCLRRVVGVREVLDRYEAGVLARANARSHRQQRGLLKRELQVGNIQTTRTQQTQFTPAGPSFDKVENGNFTIDVILPTSSRLAGRDADNSAVIKKPCYDITNCGHRSRFVVLGNKGPMIVHNCQAICRDILVDSMSRLERAGYPVIMHVHDEVVLEVDEDFGSVEEVEEIMSETPSWAKGFPVGAEGFECKRYRK
jgi:DNA polymerase